jgi:hypothetical protein
MRSGLLTCGLLVAFAAPGAPAPDPGGAALEQSFQKSVRPFVETYCLSCHGPEKTKGDLDLSGDTTLQRVAQDPSRWERVLERLEANEMPPEKAKLHPPAGAGRDVIAWIGAMRTHEAKRNPGDPGPVFARRLSNAEYDYTIRDLTGSDLRPAREFPVDPANGAGFDNSGESLTMSPSLVKKYLEAARKVADHLVLKPQGFEFAPHPVVADTDSDKFCVNQIIHVYQRQQTDYSQYFLAAWRFQNRAARGKPHENLSDVAAEMSLSPKYLAMIWSILTESTEQVGPIAALQAMWRELPAGDASHESAARSGSQNMRDFVVRVREQLVPKVANLTAPDIHNGSQSLVLWKDRQMAANRRRYAGGALVLKMPAGLTGAAATAMAVPADPTAALKYESTFNQFCATFPDAFFISERARVYLDEEKEKKLAGRLLSAGFHSQMGYFRDDAPLCELMLSEADRRELDALWKDVDFVASACYRQYTGFIWFDRTDSSFMRDEDFDFARAEDKDCTSEAKMKRLENAYVAKAIRHGAGEVALQAIHDYFQNMSASVRWVEQARTAAEPSHLTALQDFATRAYRRPLTQSERAEIVAFYHRLRQQDGLPHEDAVRDTLASILMSPHFCYRVDLPGPGPITTSGTIERRPLNDYALASRLSYFLWSSMPDETLMRLAAAGELHQPQVLVAQVKRLLQDDRSRAFATEFAGNWLDFRRFQEHNSVDRGRFPAFDNSLREAMFEEPIRFFMDVARRDRSVLDFLYADDTFVNSPLAAHYRIPQLHLPSDQWAHVEHASQYGRGGLLPMAVFLTRNSPGLRTSPVKRGNWIVKRLLGEHIPPPPPNVPELPSDESKLGNLTLRETLAAHRANKSCATCHERFDAMGLVFEGYGPVGELREQDLGGRAVENSAVFPGGGEGSGLNGLRTYIRDHRQADFTNHLCRQLLAYGLGRTLLLTDETTIDDMHSKLAASGYRFSTLIECIVTSPQFLNKRANAEVSKE